MTLRQASTAASACIEPHIALYSMHTSGGEATVATQRQVSLIRGESEGMTQRAPMGKAERQRLIQTVVQQREIATQRELVGAEPLGELDAERRELAAHRRVDVRVASGHAVARGLGDRGDPAHERAADPEDMKMRCHEGHEFYD